MAVQTPGGGDKPSFFKKPPMPGGPAPSAARSPAPAAPPAVQPSPPPRPPVGPPPPRFDEPALPSIPGAGTVRRPSFHGRGGTLFGIHIVNVLLTLVTVGVFYFWAKTRTRLFLFSQTQFEGDRFAYHGTGKELLLGTLKAMLVFGLPVGALIVVRDVLAVDRIIKTVAGLLVSILFLVFVPVAMVGARRYRLSRTSWRGIRFSFRGRVGELVRLFIKASILSALTLGLYYPYFMTLRQRFLISQSYFGSERFDFNGEGGDLLGSFILAIVLTIPTLGLCWFWFVARKRRYFWDHTLFASARFHSTVTGGALLGLYAVNALLLVFTLGLAWPWVKVRNINFAFRYVSIEGPLDLARIQQQAQYASSTGEALAGFFDSGFDLA
jgi:uncharacterized membrane protein YjgN (DUF898 family)